MNPNRLAFVLLAAIVALSGCARPRPQGVLAREEPEQQALPDGTPAVSLAGYDLVPLARFRVKARVLSAKRYWMGRESQLAPVDLALGWGRMSDSAVLEAVSVSQGFRAYHWSSGDLPIPEEEIVTHSANMHMIPATAEVRRRLEQVRAGDVVEVSGALVEAFSARDDWSWCSSLSRDDVGAGACEVVYVEALSVQ